MLSVQAEDTLYAQGIGLRPKAQVSADGPGVVAYTGARLLADLADATGLAAACSAALLELSHVMS